MMDDISSIETFELDEDMVEWLAARSRETGESQSRIVRRIIREAMLAKRYPGIEFRDGPVGRRPAVTGGADVWEIMSAVRDVETLQLDGPDAIAVWLDLPPHWVRTAMEYYADHTDEIDPWIERNKRMAVEARATWEKDRASA